MNDPFANKGYVILNAGSLYNLALTPIGGFTPINGDVILEGIEHPSSLGVQKYSGEFNELIGVTFLEGVFYPLPAKSITLASGKAIGWLL